MSELSSVSTPWSCSTRVILAWARSKAATGGFSGKTLVGVFEDVHSPSPLALSTNARVEPFPADTDTCASISVSRRASSLPLVTSNSMFPYVGSFD